MRIWNFTFTEPFAKIVGAFVNANDATDAALYMNAALKEVEPDRKPVVLDASKAPQRGVILCYAGSCPSGEGVSAVFVRSPTGTPKQLVRRDGAWYEAE